MAVTRRVSFPCGTLTLHGVLHLPAGAGPHPAAVVCHPHPLYGGSMHNNVVLALCDALPDQGWAALRFNFRGVGASEGSHGFGDAEQQDVVAALIYLETLPEISPDRLAVAGYSFGARVGLAAGCADPRVKALVAVSPPTRDHDYSFLAGCAKPKLFLCGTRDEYVAEDALRGLVAATPAAGLRVFPGVDHFWLSREAAMAEAAVAFIIGAG